MNYSTFDHNCTTYISSLTTESSANSKFVQIDLTVAIIFSVFDGVGIALGTLANLVMVFMVVTQSDLHSTTDIFTASLCISDLLASILFQPLVMRRLLARRSNPASEWGLRRFVGQMTLAASSISLVMATIDRYIVVKKPFTSCKFGFQANSIGGCRYGMVSFFGDRFNGVFEKRNRGLLVSDRHFMHRDNHIRISDTHLLHRKSPGE